MTMSDMAIGPWSGTSSKIQPMTGMSVSYVGGEKRVKLPGAVGELVRDQGVEVAGHARRRRC